MHPVQPRGWKYARWTAPTRGESRALSLPQPRKDPTTQTQRSRQQADGNSHWVGSRGSCWPPSSPTKSGSFWAGAGRCVLRLTAIRCT
jgi:hypothetical protein